MLDKNAFGLTGRAGSVDGVSEIVGSCRVLEMLIRQFGNRVPISIETNNCRGGTPWPPVSRNRRGQLRRAATECRPYSYVTLRQ